VLVQYGPNQLSILEGEPWEVCTPSSGASSVCDRGVDEGFVINGGDKYSRPLRHV
jgi:hypothetical protein